MAFAHARPDFRGRSDLLIPSLPALAGLLAAALLAGCEQGGANTPASNPAPAGIPARVLQVAPQRVPIVLEAVGQVQGSKEVEVRARVSGILLKRLYNEGDFAREGAPLFQIDPVPYQIALAQANAQMAQERARQEQTRRSPRKRRSARRNSTTRSRRKNSRTRRSSRPRRICARPSSTCPTRE